MVKTYSEFIDVINSQTALYAQIPDEYLTCEGSCVYKLYKAVQFDTCFASNASELLALVSDDEDVDFYAKYAEKEYRKLHRCLESLAAAENVPTT